MILGYAARVQRGYADAAELQHLEATLGKGGVRWARGGLERGEAHEISAQEDYTRSRVTHIKYIRSYTLSAVHDEGLLPCK
jgi:hypothetical protein